MAGTPSTYLYGFGAGSANREDLADFIGIVDPWETPLYVASPKEDANHVTVEWLEDTLAATSTGGATEGGDFNPSDRTAPSRKFNYCQIFRDDFKVTNTQRAVLMAGAKDAYGYEAYKSLRQVVRNIEVKSFGASGVCAQGTTGTARHMKTLEDMVTTNVNPANTGEWGLNAGVAGASASATLMTEDRFNGILEQIFNTGGNPDSAYVSAATKRQISGFSGQGASRRNITMAEKKLIASVDMYDSDVGIINIVLDRWVRQAANTDISHTSRIGRAWFIETPNIRYKILRPIRHVPLAAVGDATRGMVVGELTVCPINEKTHGSFWGVSNYAGAQG